MCLAPEIASVQVHQSPPCQNEDPVGYPSPELAERLMARSLGHGRVPGSYTQRGSVCYVRSGFIPRSVMLGAVIGAYANRRALHACHPVTMCYNGMSDP